MLPPSTLVGHTANVPVTQAAGGGSCSNPLQCAGDIITNAGSTVGGSLSWLDSMFKVFTGNKPSKDDYQSAVMTIVVVGLLFALLMVMLSEVSKVAVNAAPAAAMAAV